MVDHVACQLALAAGGEHFHIARTALRAERAWREVHVAALGAALQPQFALFGAFPKVLGLGRWLRQGPRPLGSGCH